MFVEEWVLEISVGIKSSVKASLDLHRNDDITITTNGVTRTIDRVLPFAHDGYGQDDSWVRANFANAEEIISTGYANWVDAQMKSRT